MLRIRRVLAVLAVGALALFAAPQPAHAGQPTVFSVIEGQESGSADKVIVLFGDRVSSFRGGTIWKDGTEVGVLERVARSRNLSVMLVPATVTEQGLYLLRLEWGSRRKPKFFEITVDLTFGALPTDSVSQAALQMAVQDDLNDAETLNGWDASYFTDASNVDGGMLGTGFFSAYDDLLDESGVGTAADQVAAGDHSHDAVHATRAELSASGNVNDPGNPVDWSQLKNVPPELADGTDDGGFDTTGDGLASLGSTVEVDFGGSTGDSGSALTVARSDHTHDTDYSTALHTHDWSSLGNVPAGFADDIDNDTTYAAGTGLDLATGTFSVDLAGNGVATTVSRSDHDHDTAYASGTHTHGWTSVTGIPADIADGDDDTTYAAGIGLDLNAGDFEVDFGGSGSATTVSRSDHDHTNAFLKKTGDSATGAIDVTNTSALSGYAVKGVSSNTTSFSAGVRGDSSAPSGYGVLGVSSSTSGNGVRGETSQSNGVGVYGYNATTSGGVYAVGVQANVPTHTGGVGVLASANGTSGKGIWGIAGATSGTTYGVHAQVSSSAGRGVFAHNFATTGGIAVAGKADGTSNAAVGVQGEVSCSDGAGVFGTNASLTGDAIGVLGRTGGSTGRGVAGQATRTTGVNYGVQGQSASLTGVGVFGTVTRNGGISYGVRGDSGSTLGVGVAGFNSATIGDSVGASGQSQSTTGRGVYGIGAATSGINYGVYGYTQSTDGYAVYGTTGTTTGNCFGVRGHTQSPTGFAVYGANLSNTGTAVGVGAASPSQTGRAVQAHATATTGASFGVHATTDSPIGVGVFGKQAATSGTAFGVYGEAVSDTGTGVFGEATHTTGVNFGVHGNTKSNAGVGVEATASLNGGLALRATNSVVYSAVAGAPPDIALFNAYDPQKLAVGKKARIDANGKGFFNGGTQASGADVAESVEVDRPKSEFEPGDVMVVDRKRARRFAKSSAKNSPLVAGIYATRPGVLLRPGQVAEPEKWVGKEVPMAVTGIVPCKVCDENGPVEIGDLLATSSTPGYAMKAPKRPEAGTLVGKALEALHGKSGKVEVLITMR